MLRHIGVHTRACAHTDMLYLFVGVFKLISLSPGENSNCLPGVKGDDKGKEERREALREKAREKQREREREKEGKLGGRG